MDKSKNALFISHDASRTGAPFLLLHFLRWFKENADMPFEILLKGDGPLKDEFASLAPTVVMPDPTSLASRVARKVGKSLGAIGADSLLKVGLKRRYTEQNIRMVYSNTGTNGDLLAQLAYLRCPVISHIHELSFWLQYRVPPLAIEQMLACTTRYIVGADAAKRNLMESYAISEERIDVVHEFIPLSPYEDSRTRKTRAQLYASQNIPESAVIVGGAGTTDWRKGPDLFIQLACAVAKQNSETPVHFVWVGGANKGIEFGELMHDVRHLGLDKCVHFLGARSDYVDVLASFDIFALVSREDCFPLVVLESALLGKPVVCFDGAGGATEFIGRDAGFSVAYMDIASMADRVLTLLRSPELGRRLGAVGRARVKAQHDVETIAPRILKIMMRTW